MQRSDQFRNFFPNHISVDKLIYNDENNRKRSQVSSNSQSQDFLKSQSIAWNPSVNSSMTDSQASSANRYEDMLASGRHTEVKDNFDMIRKHINSLINQVSTQHSTASSNNSQLNEMYRSISEIKTKQDNHDAMLSNITGMLSEIMKCLQEMKVPPNTSPRSPFSEMNSFEDDMDTSSQDGMSVDAYLHSRSKRSRTESPHQTAGATKGTK